MAHVNWLGTWVVTKKCSLPYNHTFWHMRLKPGKNTFLQIITNAGAPIYISQSTCVHLYLTRGACLLTGTCQKALQYGKNLRDLNCVSNSQVLTNAIKVFIIGFAHCPRSMISIIHWKQMCITQL